MTDLGYYPTVIVLDTQPWSIEYAQYDPVFSFYEHGIRDVVYAAYLAAAMSRNPKSTLNNHDQLAFCTLIEHDYHSSREQFLDVMNDQALSYLNEFSYKDSLLIDQVAGEIVAGVHRHWRQLYPQHRARVIPNSTQWHDSAFSIMATFESFDGKDDL